MAISHLLEKLSTEMNSTVGALDLPEGTNYSDIARMAVEGEISTGGGKQFREIEFDTFYEDMEELSEHDEQVIIDLMAEYEGGDTDIIVIKYDPECGQAPDLAQIRINDYEGHKSISIWTLSMWYSIEYGEDFTHIDTFWGTVNWKEFEERYQSMFDWIPDPSIDYSGRIIQYTGMDWNGFKQGYFYQCVEVPNTNPQEYEWEQIDVQPASGGTEPTVRFLGHYSEFNTQEKAIDLAKLEKNVIYIINDLDYPSTNKKVYVKASTSVYGSAKTFTTTILDSSKSSISNGLYLKRIDDIPAEYSSPKLIATFWNEAIWDTSGNLMRDMYNITLQSDRLSYSGSAYSLISGLGTGAQTIDGVKTFTSIPKVNSYTAPTTNTQLTAKKYVDDQDSSTYNSATSYVDGKVQDLESAMYSVNYYPTTGNPKLVGKYNGREIWRKTYEYNTQAIQNWTPEAEDSDAYLVQLPENISSIDFLVNGQATAEAYISDVQMSVSILNTSDSITPEMSCKLLQFIKSAPDEHQYFRLMVGETIKQHANKIRVTIEWVETQIQ